MAEYIERSAFLAQMKKTDRYFSVKSDIEAFPAADVAPVVHSHWAHDPITGIAYCAECQMDAVEDGTNYCPNCGARMDGDG